IWGSIHPPIDNVVGRRVGAQVGKDVWAYVQKFFNGSALPVLSCPSSGVTAECNGGLTPVTYTVTAVDGLNNPLPVTCIPPSGSGFRLGASNVVCRATDSIGLSNSCTFTVTVVD